MKQLDGMKERVLTWGDPNLMPISKSRYNRKKAWRISIRESAEAIVVLHKRRAEYVGKYELLVAHFGVLSVGNSK